MGTLPGSPCRRLTQTGPSVFLPVRKDPTDGRSPDPSYRMGAGWLSGWSYLLCLGTKALVGPDEGRLLCFQPNPPLSPPSAILAVCPLWKDTCLPQTTLSPARRRKCRISSCCRLPSRLCLGVFTRVTVRVCLDGASRGQTSQAWSHTGGGLWERGAGRASGSPLIETQPAHAELQKASQARNIS